VPPAACWTASCPGLLIDADPLERALRGCPRPVAEAFCRKLDEELAPMQAGVALARRVFAAAARPEVVAQPQLSEWLSRSFEQAGKWRRRDLNALARALEDDPELAQSFRSWLDAHRGALARKILGGAVSAAPKQSPPAERH
jgi:hypothetical protein